MKERQVILMLNEEQTNVINDAINNRIEMLEENIEMCAPDDESDAENIEAYKKEALILEELLKQLNPI